MMGYKPQAYPPLSKTFLPNLESWLSNLSSARDDAQAAHKIAQQKVKEQITSRFVPWRVGEKVWLETTNLHMNRPKKLCMKWTGPFKVEEFISHMAFCLCIPSQWKIHPIFHTSLLSTYKETAGHGPNFLQPPPDLIEGEEEYEVEAILRHWGRPSCCTFLVRWKGYSTAEDTWELEWNLGNTQPLLGEYKICTTYWISRVQPPSPNMKTKAMNPLAFSHTVIVFVLPLASLLGLICYVLWYSLNTNSSIWFLVTWQGQALIVWELQNASPDWKHMQKQSEDSLGNSGW